MAIQSVYLLKIKIIEEYRSIEHVFVAGKRLHDREEFIVYDSRAILFVIFALSVEDSRHGGFHFQRQLVLVKG